MNGAGDINADGYDDVIVGGRGVASIFSGRNLPLWADTHEGSLAKGGTQTLHLDASEARAKGNDP